MPLGNGSEASSYAFDVLLPSRGDLSVRSFGTEATAVGAVFDGAIAIVTVIVLFAV